MATAILGCLTSDLCTVCVHAAAIITEYQARIAVYFAEHQARTTAYFSRPLPILLLLGELHTHTVRICCGYYLAALSFLV